MSTNGERSDSARRPGFTKIMLRIIPFHFKAVPWLSIFSILMAIVHGVSFALTVIATQILFDAITLTATGQTGFVDCIIPLLILTGAIFGQQVMNGVHNFIDMAITLPKSAGRIRMLLHYKLQHIDSAMFEDTNFLDDLNKAKEAVPVIPYYVMGVCPPSKAAAV